MKKMIKLEKMGFWIGKDNALKCKMMKKPKKKLKEKLSKS